MRKREEVVGIQSEFNAETQRGKAATKKERAEDRAEKWRQKDF
jgi:hypothetical protein